MQNLVKWQSLAKCCETKPTKYSRILEKEGKSIKDNKFTASSTGWLYKFIQRTVIRIMTLSGEAPSADADSAEDTEEDVKNLMQLGGYYMIHEEEETDNFTAEVHAAYLLTLILHCNMTLTWNTDCRWWKHQIRLSPYSQLLNQMIMAYQTETTHPFVHFAHQVHL